VEARATLPQSIRSALLRGEPMTLAELSREIGVSEKLLPEALEKLARSVSRAGGRLRQAPASCLGCGFEFRDRARASSPSRCPSCRSERIAPAKFWLDGAK
jgi:transcriptional regulator